MKISKIYLALISVVTLLVTGCNDFLDVAPDERLEINTLEKVESTIIGSYQNSRGYRFTHFSSDDVTLAQKVYSNHEVIEDLYTWNRTFRNQTHQDSPSAYWNASYSSIAQINHALEALSQIAVPSHQQPKAEALKGEALVMRSYCHFMLVNIFAKHYDATTANSDLGVPYVFKPETKLIVNYERETVAKTYELAEKDLQEGLMLLEKNFEYANRNKYRFTIATAYNYASRFYTFRNKDESDVQKSIDYGEKALAAYGGADVMRPWVDYQADEYAPVDIYNASVGMVQNSYSWIQYDWVYHTTESIKDNFLSKNPFNNNDVRLSIFWNKGGDLFVPAYYYTLDRGRNGVSGYDLFPVYEAILNVAEGYIRLEDYQKAKDLLVVIGKNVYESYDSDDLTTDGLKAFYGMEDEKAAWTNYILFERRLQFLLQGMRWFDIKRYGLDVTHILEDGSEIKLSEVVPNKDYQIPLAAISTGMKPNK